MDIRLPDDSGIVACRTITDRRPQTRVIMLTSYADDNLIVQAEEAGACCYILKQVGNQALIEALELMRAGELKLDPVATQEDITKYHQGLRARRGGKFKDLTEREMLVLVAITDGKTNPQIANGLAVSEQTINNDINAIIQKLGVSNRFEAAIYALQNNIQSFLPERSDEAHQAGI
jgi:DNA-binding NarL/FixJ family response regulator